MAAKSSARRVARRTDALIDAGLAPANQRAALDAVAQRFAIAITPNMIDLIDPTNPADPIAQQFVPNPAELIERPGEVGDPIGDEVHSPIKGIVHRYPDRVLLKPLHTCPVYCRFCFRREMVGPGAAALNAAELNAALAYIRTHKEVWEVIVTGGDPFMLSARRLSAIVVALGRIPHVAVIRFHTRVPVAEPARVTPDLVAALKSDKAVYVAIHCNHARELTPAARQACRRLGRAGIPLLGQSVLLKGVNDDPATLEALMRALVTARIKPYYLHHGDLARGTGHFRTTIEQGQNLMRVLRGRVSGLCQPAYVLDLPGGHGKVPIGPCCLDRVGDGGYTVEDYRGRRHAYPEKA